MGGASALGRDARILSPLSQAFGADDQQLYGGTQSALSRTLLLWISSCAPSDPSSSRTRCAGSGSACALSVLCGIGMRQPPGSAVRRLGDGGASWSVCP